MIINILKTFQLLFKEQHKNLKKIIIDLFCFLRPGFSVYVALAVLELGLFWEHSGDTCTHRSPEKPGMLNTQDCLSNGKNEKLVSLLRKLRIGSD